MKNFINIKISYLIQQSNPQFFLEALEGANSAPPNNSTPLSYYFSFLQESNHSLRKKLSEAKVAWFLTFAERQVAVRRRSGRNTGS